MRGFNDMFGFLEDWQNTRRAKNIADEAVRTRSLIKELDTAFPHLKEPNVIDPALRALLEQKVQDGRMTQDEFEVELSKYNPS